MKKNIPFRNFRPSLVIAFCISLFSSTEGVAQGEIPVNMYTGQPSIGLPLTTITSGNISVPVSISYDANNSSAKSSAGFGWSVSVGGGSVSREVRGLPDDFGYNDSRKGWLYEKSPELNLSTDVGNFTPSADTEATTFADEAADHAKLEGYRGVFDTEPDVFNFTAGDVSGSFVFDNSHIIRTIPYRDVKIEPIAISGVDKKIIRFIITTNDGYKYTYEKLATSTIDATRNQYLNTVHFLTTDYELYEQAVSYTAQWLVTRIDSPDGHYVTFTYNDGTPEVSEKEINVGYYKTPDPFYADPTDLEVRNIYTTKVTSVQPVLIEITGSTGDRVGFTYSQLYNDDQDNASYLTQVELSDSRKGSTSVTSFVKRFQFQYKAVPYSNEGLTAYWRKFLMSVTEESGCDRMPPHKFSYTRIDGLDELRLAITKYNAWGFGSGLGDKWSYADAPVKHNIPKLYIYPSEPEEHRYRLHRLSSHVGEEYILEGVERGGGAVSDGLLQSITYPHGAKTTFQFSPNEYYDAHGNQTLDASGFRIMWIAYYDGFSATPVEKVFNYLDPATGKSSGHLLRKPVLSFPAFKWKEPFNQNSTNPQHEKNFGDFDGENSLELKERWKYLTIRVESDIAPSETTHGSVVGYKFVTVNRPGAGKATFEYHVPGVYGESITGPWESTVNRFARPYNIPMGHVTGGGPWRFPHSPNALFDYQRGLIWRKSDYNSTGKLVQQTETTYTDLYKSTQAVKVWGLRYDRYALSEDRDANRRIYFYGKYFLLTDADRVVEKEIVKTFDVNDVTNTKFSVDTTRYTYSSSHKMLSQVKHTAPDGSIRSTRFKYPKDYANVISGTREKAVYCLSYMQNNFRHGAPVETISTLKMPGGSEVITGASLIRFDTLAFSAFNPVPESIWSLELATPPVYSSFVQSSIQLVNGTYKLVFDTTAYVKKTSFSTYTAKGQLISSRDIAARRNSSTFYSAATTLPVVQLANASANEVGFSDFDNVTGLEFTSSTSYYGTGRTGANGFYPGVLLQKTLTKGSADQYVLSFWIKSSATVDFIVTLKHTSGSPEYFSTPPISVTSSGGSGFKYVQQVLPVTNVPAGQFIITIQATGLPASPPGGSAPGLLPVIDDVFFFPDNATMASMDYAIPFGVSTITTGTGEANHSVHDNLGRVRYVKDRDLNIVKKVSYNFHTDSDPLHAEFDVYEQIIVGRRAHFTARRNSCLSDISYYWDFGNGFVQGADTVSYLTYSMDMLNVTLRTVHPLHGQRERSIQFPVDPQPLTVEICAKGVMEYTGSSVVSSYSCSQITANPPDAGIIFRAAFVTGCSSGCTYKWYKKETGSLSWSHIGTGIQFTHSKIVPGMKSFLMRCEATSEEGAVATSSPMSVTINP
jgi:hypothetical protein